MSPTFSELRVVLCDDLLTRFDPRKVLVVDLDARTWHEAGEPNSIRSFRPGKLIRPVFDLPSGQLWRFHTTLPPVRIEPILRDEWLETVVCLTVHFGARKWDLRLWQNSFHLPRVLPKILHDPVIAALREHPVTREFYELYAQPERGAA